jgi:hypothetical protein
MCFKERKKPAVIVTVLSVIVIILGIIMIIESAIYYTAGSILTTDLGSITAQVKTFHTSTFAILMAFSCSALIAGILGSGCLCKPCVNNLALPIVYGITLFLVWIVILIVGIIITAVSFTSPTELQNFCSGNTTNSRIAWASDQIDVIDVSINNYADTYMCSQICPCATTYSAPWLNITEATLNSYNRTKVIGTNATNSQGYYRFFFNNVTQNTTNSSAGTVANFVACNKWI